MPFRLSLYRAADGLGPMHDWEREHRQSLGVRNDVQAALDQVLQGLRWEESDGLLFASCPFGGEDHACEIWLFGEPDEELLEINVYSLPPAIRAIMSGLGLNGCYAFESGELYYPFQAGDHWPNASEAARG